MKRTLLFFVASFALLHSNLADAKPKKKKVRRTKIITSPLGFSLFTGFPLLAGGGIEYKLAPGFFVDAGISLGVASVGTDIEFFPMFEGGFSNAVGRGPIRSGIYLKGASTLENIQNNAFASVGYNLRAHTRRPGNIINFQLGPGFYINQNATSIFGSQFGVYAKLAYFHHPILAKKTKKRRRRRRR